MWVAAGFIGAFAASVFTVIYTGLNVGGYSSAEFDAGFRSVTMTVGDVRSIDLVFDSERAIEDATLSVALPAAVGLTGPAERSLPMSAGENVVPVEVVARQPGSGYLVARVEADVPIGLYQVFLTVEAPPAAADAQ